MSKYLKIDLKNLDPLRIADDRTSQHGQTDTLRYIPGSALRGYVMSELAKRVINFETWKPDFFNGKIRFLNAYLTVDGKEMIPRGKTRLMAGDRLTVMTDERDAGYIHDKLENLCYTSF